MSDPTAQEAGASTPANPPRENLVRGLGEAPTLERAEGAEMPTLTGHFAVWDQWTEIRSRVEGNFMERFAPGAMNKTLAENTPKVLFDHGNDPTVGNKVLGIPSRVEPDAIGAYYEVPLFATSYNRDLTPGLDGGAYGASFRFSVMQEDVNAKPARSEYNPRGITERTVTEARVAEFGPVTWPAYAGATAGLRSMTDEFLMERFLEDEEMVERLAQRISDKQRVAVYFGVPAVGFNEPLVEPVEAERETPSLEPEPSEAATPESPDSEPAPATRTEPEPSEATTRSHADLFWFADTSKLKGANT